MRIPSGMQYFHLEQPEGEMILCDRAGCEAIADYVEVEEDGTEHRLCAFHTQSHTYAARPSIRTLKPHVTSSRSYKSQKDTLDVPLAEDDNSPRKGDHNA